MSCSAEQLKVLNELKEPIYIVISSANLIECVFTFFAALLFKAKLEKSTATKHMANLLKFYLHNTMIYVFAYGIPEALHLISRFLLPGCDALVPVKWCVLVRIIQSACSVFFLIFQTGFFFNIILENSWPRYRSNPKNAYIIGSVMVVFSIVVVIGSLFIDLSSNELQVSCSSLEHKSRFIQFYVFICLENMNVILLAVNLTWCIYRHRRRSEHSFRFMVNARKTLRSIHSDLSLTWKSVLLIIVSYGYYTGFSLYFAYTDKITAANFLISNSVPTFCMCNIIIWHLQIKKFGNAPVSGFNQKSFWSRVKAFFGKSHKAYTVVTTGVVKTFVRSSHPLIAPVQ